MNEYWKMRALIRDVVMSIDEEDRFKQADKVAGIVLDALGYKNRVYYPHSNETVNG